MRGLDQQNRRARERARVQGKPTWSRVVTEHWPACTACGQTIRHPAGDQGRLRRCDCPGVGWSCWSNGWRRIEFTEPEEAGDG